MGCRCGISNIYLPKEFFNIIAAPYLKHCSYYGKDVPEYCGAHVGHQYEGCWVNLHLNNDDFFLRETLSYIREGLGDFCADDEMFVLGLSRGLLSKRPFLGVEDLTYFNLSKYSKSVFSC